MGIRVSHEPAAGLLAAPAYGAGLGQFRQRQAEIQRQQFNIDRQRQDALRAQEDERQRRDAALALEAQDRAQQNQYRTQQQAMSLFGQQVEAQQRQQQLDQGAAFDQQKLVQQGLKDGTLKYTTAQRQQIAKLQGEWDRVNATKSLRPRDRELALQEINGQLQSIQPRPVMESDRPQSIEDIIAQRVRQLDPNDKNSPTVILDREGEISKVIQPRNVGAQKPQVEPGTVVTNPITNKPDGYYDQTGAFRKHSDEAESQLKQQEAAKKEALAAAKELKKEADSRYQQELKDLKEQGIILALPDKDALWRSIYQGMKAEQDAVNQEMQVDESGMPVRPADNAGLQYPEAIQGRLTAIQEKKQQAAMVKEVEDRYDALKQQLDAINTKSGVKGGATVLPEYQSHEQAVQKLKQFGLYQEKERPESTAESVGAPPTRTGTAQPGTAPSPLAFTPENVVPAGETMQQQQQPAMQTAVLPPTFQNRALVQQLKAAGYTTIKAALESGNPQIVAIAQQLAQMVGE